MHYLIVDDHGYVFVGRISLSQVGYIKGRFVLENGIRYLVEGLIRGSCYNDYVLLGSVEHEIIKGRFF